MADRYWVGGTANWDGTAGTKWATTSGGAGGASVPTSADDVFFDAASGAVTCTIAAGNTGAKSINCTGFTGTLTGSTAITVSGSITLVSGMAFTYSGTVTINGTGTLTTAGKSLGNVTINAPGNTVTLGDAIILGTLTVTLGTFTTNNFNVTASTLASNNSNVRTINLGSSTVSLSLNGATAVNFIDQTNLTFNAGTSQINISGTSGGVTIGSGVTFYNLAFTTTNPGTRNINGSNTFNNLTVTATAGVNTSQVSISSNQTINGTLSTTGTAGNRRVWFRSDTYGVRRTLTVNSAPSLTDADFRDIIVNGTAAPISGTRIGNRGACAGITFDAPKTVYWNFGGGPNRAWTDNGWASTSGGTPNTDNFPLPQDTAIVDNAGAATTIVLQNSAICNLDMSGRTTSVTITIDAGNIVYGSWTNGSGTTISNINTLTFSGEGTKTITSAGKTFSCPINIDCFGGSVLVNDALVCTGGSFEVVRGTFDTQGYSCQWGNFEFWNTAGIKFVYFRNSTITSTGSYPFGSSTNGSALADFMTLDAGTSTYNCSVSAIAFYGFNKTFYNISMPSGTINNSFTCNNLTFTAPGTGLSTVDIGANITVNGTLSCAGASATSRRFLRSSTLGTTRTITANAISANDCDFRDITIAGSAAGASPTRAGDCGGNSGITFPSPKTVYWNLAGSQNWNATAWATISGGTPAVNNFPLPQDTAVFDDAGAAGTVFLSTFNIGTLNAASRTSAITLQHNGLTFYGSYILGSGVTVAATGTMFFSGRGTQTFTSAGKTITFPITVNSFSGTFQLGDALNCSGTLTLTSGTFDAVSYNVTINNYLGQSGGHTLRMGSGLWTLTGTGSTWNATGLTNFFKGTADILLSNNTTTTRDFAGFGLSYNKLTIGGNTSTSTTTITGNNQFTELASTKTVAHTIALGGTIQTFGKWTVTGSAGNVVTLTGTGTSHVLAGSATSGIDYLAMGSIGFAATSPAEFYAGANSTGTAGAPVFRTATPTPRTLYWVGGTGNWSNTARWSLSSGGAGGQAIPTSLDNVIFDSASNATAYTATIDANSRCNELTISAPASGNITLAGASQLAVHGSVSLPATGITRTYTGGIVLSGSTTGKTFTTNGVSLNSSVTINGVGCGWALGSAFSIATGTDILTVLNGYFDTGNYNVSANRLTSNSTNTRTISLGSSTVTIGGQVQLGTTTNLTFNAGTSLIDCTTTGVTFVGGGLTFYNVSFTSTNPVSGSNISGANTFNNLTIAGRSSAGIGVLSLSENQTINGTFTCSGTSATQRGFVRSGTIGTTRTLTVGTLAANDCDFRDITIAGTAAGTSPTRAGDCGGNSGITFPAPKTVYWRNATSANWGATTWSFTDGGTADVTAFPLAQDTATFPSGYPNSGATVTLNAAYNIGTIDMSARTTNTMTLANGSTTPTIYGNWINGTGTTLTGSGQVTFAGRGSQTITSAGKTFTQAPFINSPSGSVTLQDAFVCTQTTTDMDLTAGTFDANGYNVTLSGRMVLNSANNKTVNIGSGTWTIGTAGIGNTWLGAANLTVTGTGIISIASPSGGLFQGGGLSYSGITLNQGSTGTLTITGNNTFAGITSTATGATTIALGTTTQRVGAFTVTGTAGNVVTITGNTSNLIYTGGGSISGIDYLNVQGRVYGSAGQITDVWYAGANSVNSGSLGWVFAAGVAPPPSANTNFFLMFG